MYTSVPYFEGYVGTCNGDTTINNEFSILQWISKYYLKMTLSGISFVPKTRNMRMGNGKIDQLKLVFLEGNIEGWRNHEGGTESWHEEDSCFPPWQSSSRREDGLGHS